MRRRHLVFIPLLLGLIGIGVWMGGPLYDWATKKVVYERSKSLVAAGLPPELSTPAVWRITRSRWGKTLQQKTEVWHPDTGMLSHRLSFEMLRTGVPGPALSATVTGWSREGRILGQTNLNAGMRIGGRGPQHSYNAPPWLWGETDQTEPTAPWVLAGLTLDEWWDSVPDRMKQP